MALSRLITLSISSLRSLDIDANKFYDRAHRFYDAAILTRRYTQHALRPYIDSEIYNIRHFINKGIEFINLPSIFKDKFVISSIPTYFENKESPIIIIPRLAPVLKTIFHQCVISYTCSQPYSDGSVLKQSHQSKTGYKYMI